MTRPTHIDNMIKERIISGDVLAYIEQLEQALKDSIKDYIERGDTLAEFLREGEY